MNSSLKILMITHKRQFEAAPRSLVMATHLVKRGHHVSILLVSQNKLVGIKEYHNAGVHCIEFPDLLWGRLRSGWDIWNMLNRIHYLSGTKHSYDLIHCFETRPVTIYPALFFRKKHQIPMITDWNDWWGHHGLIEVNRPDWYRFTPFGAIETFYEEAFRVRADGLTVIASALRDRAIRMGVDPLNIVQISGGATTDVVPERSKQDCRRHLNFGLEDPIIGFGSANSHLDIEIIMEAMVIVAKKYPDVKLLITGRAKQDIYGLVDQYGLKENILFTGYLSVEDYYWHMGCADLCLLPMADLPYNHGRWPNKMGDYLCVGRPTVSNPVGEIHPLFKTHEVGLLAEWDAVDFAEKIITLLDYPQVAEQFGKNARQVAENEYDWHILVDELEKFYCKISSHKEKSEVFQINKSVT